MKRIFSMLAVLALAAPAGAWPWTSPGGSTSGGDTNTLDLAIREWVSEGTGTLETAIQTWATETIGTATGALDTAVREWVSAGTGTLETAIQTWASETIGTSTGALDTAVREWVSAGTGTLETAIQTWATETIGTATGTLDTAVREWVSAGTGTLETAIHDYVDAGTGTIREAIGSLTATVAGKAAAATVAAHDAQIDDIQLNLYDMVLRVAAGDSLTQVPMTDGIVDTFGDTNGVSPTGCKTSTWASGSFAWSNYTTAVEGGAPESGILAKWEMDDDAASTAVADSSGNNLDGASYANTEDMSVAGKLGTALDFDGLADYVSLIAAAMDLTDNGSLTHSLSLWVKPTGTWDSGMGDAIVHNIGGSNRSTLRWNAWESGKLTFHIYDGGSGHYASVTTTFQDAVWYHVVTVFNDESDSMQLWINNVLAAEASPTTLEPYLDAAGLGAESQGAANSITGVFDQVVLYTNALDAAGVAALWNGGDGTTTFGDSTPESGGYMTLISTNFHAAEEPTASRLLVTAKPTVGVITANVNFVASTSKDAGATWTQVELAAVTTWLDGYTLYSGTNTLAYDDGSKTNMQWKIETVNTQTAGVVEGVALQWD